MRRNPGLRIGSYELLSLAGDEGVGEVWKARDTITGHEAALRLLPHPRATSADRFARFERDVHELTLLHHPHLARTYGIVDADEVRALAVEWVDGPTLARRVAGGALPVDDCLRIAAQIAGALAAVHRRGIVHGSVTPVNVRFSADDEAKITGCALLDLFESEAEPRDGPHLTSARLIGVVIGNAAYMSPEQVRGALIDAATDVWAFGCVLYEMLSGRPAFGGSDVVDTMASVCTSAPEWTRLPPTAPAWLTELLRLCLDKNAATRLRDLGEVEAMSLEELGPAGAHEALLRDTMLDEVTAEVRTDSPAFPLVLERLRAELNVSREGRLAIEPVVKSRYERALAQLSQREREAVRLRLEHGMDYTAMTGLLGVRSRDAARMRFARVMVRLMTFFKRKPDEHS
jgi:serine/threonine-protein kinase